MGRITALLKDLPADRAVGRATVRRLLSKEQWDEVLAHYDRGVSVKAIWAALSGNIVPFFNGEKQLQSAIYSEKKARQNAAKK